MQGNKRSKIRWSNKVEKKICMGYQLKNSKVTTAPEFRSKTYF